MVWAPKLMHTAKALSLRLTRTVGQTIMISKFHHPLLRFLCLDQQAEKHWKKNISFLSSCSSEKLTQGPMLQLSKMFTGLYMCPQRVPLAFMATSMWKRMAVSQLPLLWAPWNGLFHKYFRWIVKGERGFRQWSSNHSTLKNNLKNLFKDTPFWGLSPSKSHLGESKKQCF